MKKFCVSTILFFVGLQIFCQSTNSDYYTKYQKLLSSGDYEALELHVSNWEKDGPQSAEMYIANFNYYLNRNISSMNAMGRMPDGRYGLFPQTVFNKEDFIVATGYLEKGIQLYPDRMDMIMGLRYVYFINKNFDLMTDLVLKTINRSKVNHQAWCSLFNESVPAYTEYGYEYFENFLLESLTMLNGWFDVAGVEYGRIAKESLAVYPESLVILNMASNYYIQTEDYNKGLELLLRAHKMDSKDEIIIFNIARTYELMGNTAKAIEYYGIVAKSANPDYASAATESIRKVRERKNSSR